MSVQRCSICGEDIRFVWLMGDPPEPYGEVCGCPDQLAELADARSEKRAMDAERLPSPTPGDEDV